MTYYVRDENNRSRIDNWRNDMRAKRYVRYDAYPKFFRTASKNHYVREKSNFGRQNSNARNNSKPGYN